MNFKQSTSLSAAVLAASLAMGLPTAAVAQQHAAAAQRRPPPAEMAEAGLSFGALAAGAGAQARAAATLQARVRGQLAASESATGVFPEPPATAPPTHTTGTLPRAKQQSSELSVCARAGGRGVWLEFRMGRTAQRTVLPPHSRAGVRLQTRACSAVGALWRAATYRPRRTA